MQTPRVIIIYEAQLMNIAANNALLKSLEEPSDNVVFILVSQSLSTIPATILSRTQKIYFPPAQMSELKSYLTSQNIKLDLASLLGGAPLLANEYLLKDKLEQRESILKSLQVLILNQASACQISAKWSKFDEIFVLEVLFSWFSDLIKIHHGAVNNELINQNSTLELKNNLKNLQPSKLFTIIDKLVNFTGQISFARQINTSLWFDELAIEINGELSH
jgi:DNA polymerase-3 subunit delta'